MRKIGTLVVLVAMLVSMFAVHSLAANSQTPTCTWVSPSAGQQIEISGSSASDNKTVVFATTSNLPNSLNITEFTLDRHNGTRQINSTQASGKFAFDGVDLPTGTYTVTAIQFYDNLTYGPGGSNESIENLSLLEVNCGSRTFIIKDTTGAKIDTTEEETAKEETSNTTTIMIGAIVLIIIIVAYSNNKGKKK